MDAPRGRSRRGSPKNPRTQLITDTRPILITCGALADERGTRGASALLEPAEVAEGVHGWRLLALGTVEDVERHEAAPAARRIDASGCVLLPAFVNAHTHLDLTHMGPRPFDPEREGFMDWVGMIRGGRVEAAEAVRASVEEGIRRSLAGGVVAVGDIAGVGRTEPLGALRDSSLLGASFVEFFGLGSREAGAIAQVDALLASTEDRARGVARSLQPHAPYSAGLGLYEHAAHEMRTRGLPITTHLAETLDERAFVESCGGPIARFLESLDLLDASARAAVGEGRHPIAHLRDMLDSTPFVLAHVNDCPREYMDLLARSRATVAYCPRAHEYFGHGEHAYRKMLAAGVRVALATDSIVNIPRAQADRLTPFDDARLLYNRDGVEPTVLLQMITTTPAEALGLEAELFRFTVGGVCAGINAVGVGPAGEDPVRVVFASDASPVLVRPGAGLDETLAKLGGLGR